MPQDNQIPSEESLELLLTLLAEEGEVTEEKKESQVPTPESSKNPKSAVSAQNNEPPWRRKSKPTPNTKQSPARSQPQKPASSEFQKCQEQIADLEQKLRFLQAQVEQPTDLINPLLPLIRQLLEMKNGESKEAILEAVVPVIDKIIAQRAQEDRVALAQALASTLPLAIKEQVKQSPEEIAEAIAPEMAFAIERQIRLKQNAISQALGSEMGHAIKTQIELERDAMVDALYPVIGDTIGKYMADVIDAINEKVENTLSPAGMTRKFRARLQGVSEAELILRESMPFTVQAVFLIHKTSGLLIQEAQPTASADRLESEMLAGMLTAIRQFVNDCVTNSEDISELNEIEYGNSRIILEVAGYCYLAVVINGTPSVSYQRKIQQTLSAIVQEHGERIKAYDGDPETIPEPVQPLLERLLVPDGEGEKKQKKFPTALLVLVLGLAGMILIPWGVFWYRQRFANNLESQVASALEATPALSVYALRPEISDETLTLTGRVPSASLREQAGTVAQSQLPDNLQLNNQIIAVNVPPPSEEVAASVQRTAAVWNQQSGVFISARYQDREVRVRGVIPQVSVAEEISNAFTRIPGVTSVTNTAQLKPEALQRRLYFDRGSANVPPAEIDQTIKPIAQFLKANPHLHLKIIGYSDQVGNERIKQEVAIARSQAIKKRLVEQDISPQRLVTSAAIELPPGVTPQSPARESRIVRFSLFMPASDPNST